MGLRGGKLLMLAFIGVYVFSGCSKTPIREKPVDPPVIDPAQVRFPVESSTVQPVLPEPPPRSIDPVPPVVAILIVVVPVITGLAPPKVRAVEVKVLVS